RKQPLAARIPCAVAICLTLAGLFLIGCGRSPSDSASTQPNDPTTSLPASEGTEFGVVLRADPNPVPGGTDVGKTTIIWQTGSMSVADIYYFDGKDETLFASDAKGSKEAPFIRPGSNEFRLYNQGQHKLVTKLIVTMPESSGSGS